MDWIAIDGHNRRWEPYVVTDTNGHSHVLLHPELADTDMGDLFMYELAYMLGPVIIQSLVDGES